MAWFPFWLEWMSIAATVAIALAYFLWSYWLSPDDPERLVQARHARFRRDWLNAIRDESGAGILAVQTIRNSLMSASFLASSLMLALMAAFSFTTETFRGLHAAAQGAVAPGTVLLVAKSVLLIVSLAFAFAAFVLAVRLYHHVGYMVVLPEESRTGDYLDRAGDYFGLGLRVMPFSGVVLVGHMATPLMPVAAAVLVVALVRFDRS